MGEESDQVVVEFCQRLGLAHDGYLNEQEFFSVVCNCIGIVPEEMLRELFEELDTDKDGRVCLEELSQMLRGMQKNPQNSSSPVKKSNQEVKTEPSVIVPNFSSPSSTSVFSVLDPHNSGFTKVNDLVEMWSQWGIRNGLELLIKDLGFSPSANSINLHDLSKALEDELDSVLVSSPSVLQAALLTYKTEAHYLRSICESMQGERDKLKGDVLEAHQRQLLLAQEIDEQNARLEAQMASRIDAMELKYSEQLSESQMKISVEKEALQQALFVAESQLKNFQTSDSRLKSQISQLNNENSALEQELRNFSNEIQVVNKAKAHLEKEISRFVDLESRFMEMENRGMEGDAISQAKLLEQTHKLQQLQDQNDELSSQLEGMREKIKAWKAFQEKRSTKKKRKGSAKSLLGVDEDELESPMEKIGKFHLGEDISDELDENSLLSWSSQPDSGNFPIGINLGISMGESSTDQIIEHKTLEKEMEQQCIKMTNSLSNVSVQTEPPEGTENNRHLTNNKINQLEQELVVTKREKQELKEQCEELEASLDLLRVEYEKCEDYWHDKLSEAREIYESDKQSMDDKFQDLLLKIKEYEENFVQSTFRLPVIEERASLEAQVVELEEECEELRKQLGSLKGEHDSVILTFQRQVESRAMEEIHQLEEQVGVLRQKCHEYENRLSSLATAAEDPSTLEQGKLLILRMNPDRDQDRFNKNEPKQLAEQSKEREQKQNSSVWGESSEDLSLKEQSLRLFELLHSGGARESGVSPLINWPQRYAPISPIPSSPKSLPAPAEENGNYGAEPWAPPQLGKKTWCHVELGWLQGLRARLRQREEQNSALHAALQYKEMEHEKIIAELRYNHEIERRNLENLVESSQSRQKELTEKYSHSERNLKELWLENAKLVANLHTTQMRVVQLENLLNFHPPPTNQNSPRSLPYPHFST